jgi:hypothetical protein
VLVYADTRNCTDRAVGRGLRASGRGKARAAPGRGPKSAAKGIIEAGATESPGPQMPMGRIEHTLLDEGRASSPTDLRPSPATTPYHKKCQMFLSKTKGRSLLDMEAPTL